MTPYYSDDCVTIYHGRWQDLEWPDPDLVLADPPYGIKHPTDFASRGRSTKGKPLDYRPVVGDDMTFDPAPWLGLAPLILWGANYYADALPPSNSWLVWDKRVREGVGVNDQADGELAWSNATKGVRIFRHMWNGMWRDSERGEHYHPTQKPVALMRWCLGKAGLREGQMVYDPFMGSGPVPVAAKSLGLRCVAVEVDEAYCERAALRCSQGVLGLSA